MQREPELVVKTVEMRLAPSPWRHPFRRLRWRRMMRAEASRRESVSALARELEDELFTRADMAMLHGDAGGDARRGILSTTAVSSGGALSAHEFAQACEAVQNAPIDPCRLGQHVVSLHMKQRGYGICLNCSAPVGQWPTPATWPADDDPILPPQRGHDYQPEDFG